MDQVEYVQRSIIAQEKAINGILKFIYRQSIRNMKLGIVLLGVSAIAVYLSEKEMAERDRRIEHLETRVARRDEVIFDLEKKVKELTKGD